MAYDCNPLLAGLMPIWLKARRQACTSGRSASTVCPSRAWAWAMNGCTRAETSASVRTPSTSTIPGTRLGKSAQRAGVWQKYTVSPYAYSNRRTLNR